MTNVSLSLGLTRSPRHEENGEVAEYVEVLISIRDAVHQAALGAGATVIRCYVELERPTAAVLRASFWTEQPVDNAYRLASIVDKAARMVDAEHPKVLYSCHPVVTTDAHPIDF